MLLAVIAMVLVYQNCGDTKLKQLTKSVDSRSIAFEKPTPTYLKPPVPFDGVMRAAFFIDMSASTVTSPCPDSVDEPNPLPGSGINCENPELGSDSKLRRFKIISKWLDQMEAHMAQNNIPAENFKAAVIPFSGGSTADQLLSYGTYTTGFTSIANVRIAIKNLRDAQEKFATPNKPMFMYTSVPANKIEKMYDFIAREIDALKASVPVSKLPQSRFEVVFISDGVPKPRAKHAKETIRKIWDYKKFKRVKYVGYLADGSGCIIASCKYSSQTDCDIFAEPADYSATGLDCMGKYEGLVDNMVIGQGPYLPPFSNSCNEWERQIQEPIRLCFDALDDFKYDTADRYPASPASIMQVMATEWGSPIDNLVSNIMYRIFNIRQLFQVNTEAQFRFSFLRLDSDLLSYKTSAEELDPEVNWIIKAREVYKQHRHADVRSDEPPFALFPGVGAAESFKLSQFYTFNINARINSNNALDIDSDGDGLFDSEEIQLGKNPNNPRSNGVCGDKVAFISSGCIQAGCDANIDKDGDSLNECEELTLGTSDLDFDTDGDAAPDSIEVIYGLRPLLSDYKQDSNTDGVTNLNNLRYGLSPFIYLSQVAAEYLINLKVDFYNYKLVTNALGQSVQTPGYIIQLKNVRVVNTQNSEDTLQLYKTRAKLPADLWSHRLIGGNHSAGVNRILFLGRVNSVQNPGDAYWIIKVNEYNFATPPSTVNIDLESFTQVPVLDPQGEIQ